mmetsp:Transcript_20271/g.42373  ORF Transcript_20271/g.42373 Transcript_20271/m.42373 type:complete len:205 (-) Transcript_20271:262-876(-)
MESGNQCQRQHDPLHREGKKSPSHTYYKLQPRRLLPYSKVNEIFCFLGSILPKITTTGIRRRRILTTTTATTTIITPRLGLLVNPLQLPFGTLAPEIVASVAKMGIRHTSLIPVVFVIHGRYRFSDTEKFSKRAIGVNRGNFECLVVEAALFRRGCQGGKGFGRSVCSSWCLVLDCWYCLVLSLWFMGRGWWFRIWLRGGGGGG